MRGDHRGAGRHRLERHEAVRLVQRRDHDATRPVQQAAKLVTGDEAGEVDEVADALHIDLQLQLGQVGAPPGDDAVDPRHPVAEAGDGPGEDLETLLVGDAAPGDDEDLTRRRFVTGRPSFDAHPVGHTCDPVGRQLETVDHLLGHEVRQADDARRPVRQPGLDRVDRRRIAGRHLTAVPTPFGAVEGDHQRCPAEIGERVGRPRHVPVVGMDHVGPPPVEQAEQLHEVMVGRGRLGDGVVGGQPGQLGRGPQHTHALDGLVGRRAPGPGGEDGDLVPGPGK